jgi:hypothetical protein
MKVKFFVSLLVLLASFALMGNISCPSPLFDIQYGRYLGGGTVPILCLLAGSIFFAVLSYVEAFGKSLMAAPVFLALVLASIEAYSFITNLVEHSCR